MPEQNLASRWDQASLSTVFCINTASVIPALAPGEIFTHYSIPAFDLTGGPAEELGVAIESNKTRISEPSVLVSKLNPRKPRVVAVTNPSQKTCCSTEFICYVPVRAGHDLRYWAAYLGSGAFSRRLERVAVGSTNSHTRVTPAETLKWQVSDVPAAEQALIADILDAIDDAIRETEALIAKLNLLRLGLIDDLLTRGIDDNGELRSGDQLVETPIGRRPKSWIVAPLGRFIEKAEYGVSVAMDNEEGVPVLRMNNIQDGEFDLSDLKRAPELIVGAFRLRVGDVLFNRTNSIEHVGKAAIWRHDTLGPAFASYLVRLHPTRDLTSEYLHTWLNWGPVQRAIRRFATPGVQQVNINPTNLKRTVVALPSRTNEQRQVVERINPDYASRLAGVA